MAHQPDTLDYSSDFQYDRLLSFQLAEKIAGPLPGELNHMFFIGFGSGYADASIKVARTY